ncbi:MAG: hypothetical protein C5B49_12390 [Bdellovibrio sp.]|nr:MAG: hypothetical protein C5B49_12390 [Bdellovibrio sp.]
MAYIGLYLPMDEIERVKKRRCTFCQPKERTEKLAPGHVQKTIDSIGQVFEVADESGKIHTKARLVDAFLTTFGNPDGRLLDGYGFKSDTRGFQESYREFWSANIADFKLQDDTELFVFTYEPA